MRSNNKPISVVVLGEGFGFPNGMAATSRVKNIAKGLFESNANVHILCVRGTELSKNPNNLLPNGQIKEGITFEYTGRKTIRSDYWLLRRWDDFYGMLIAFYRLLQLKYQKQLDAVIIYSRNSSVVKKVAFLCKLLGVLSLLELCEWPLAIANIQNKELRRAKKFCFGAVKQVNAAIPISTYIEEQVQIIAKEKGISIPLIKIPILVDGAVRPTLCDSKKTEPYMLYTGSLAYKDISKMVVDIYVELEKRKITLPVKITGAGCNHMQEEIQEYARLQGVSEHIEFVGYVNENTLKQLQQCATVLLAPLPDNLQSVSRFPTKLGYYLASGTPVVTSAVGEVNYYLEDGKTAFVAKSFSAQAFASKVEEIYMNPDLALQVGKEGAKLALSEFDYHIHGKRLFLFIEDLISLRY